MTIMSAKTVFHKGAEECIEWGGEFRGKLCLNIEVSDGSVRLCIRGKARRLGEFKECFNLLDACYTLFDAVIGKLKICISDIELLDGLPRCLRLKLIVDPIFGGDITLVNEKICFFGVLMADEFADLAVDSDVPSGSIILVPSISAD